MHWTQTTEGRERMSKISTANHKRRKAAKKAKPGTALVPVTTSFPIDMLPDRPVRKLKPAVALTGKADTLKYQLALETVRLLRAMMELKP